MLAAVREDTTSRAAFGVWTLGAGLVRGRVGIPEEVEFRDGVNAAAVRTIVRQPERGAVVKFGHLPPLFARVERSRRRARGPDDRRHRLQRLDDADRSRPRSRRRSVPGRARASSSIFAATREAC